MINSFVRRLADILFSKPIETKVRKIVKEPDLMDWKNLSDEELEEIERNEREKLSGKASLSFFTTKIGRLSLLEVAEKPESIKQRFNDLRSKIDSEIQKQPHEELLRELQYLRAKLLDDEFVGYFTEACKSLLKNGKTDKTYLFETFEEGSGLEEILENQVVDSEFVQTGKEANPWGVTTRPVGYYRDIYGTVVLGIRWNPRNKNIHLNQLLKEKGKRKARRKEQLEQQKKENELASLDPQIKILLKV